MGEGRRDGEGRGEIEDMGWGGGEGEGRGEGGGRRGGRFSRRRAGRGPSRGRNSKCKDAGVTGLTELGRGLSCGR